MRKKVIIIQNFNKLDFLFLRYRKSMRSEKGGFHLKLFCLQNKNNSQPYYKLLSPYLTGMRRVHDGFANRFAKPSRTIAKGSHGISKSSHASPRSSRTVRQSFKHVILFCATKIITKPSPSHRICREPVANPSQTFANTLQGSFRDLHNATNMRHK